MRSQAKPTCRVGRVATTFCLLLLTACAGFSQQREGAKVPEEPKSTSLIHLAAKAGKVKEVEGYLQQDASLINFYDNLGMTPLHVAAESGNLEVVKLLLNKGADTNAKTKVGQDTPLHLALYRRRQPIAILLLDNGADATAVNKIGASPLTYAAWCAMPDIIEKLQTRGAKFNKNDGSVSDMLFALTNRVPLATSAEFKKTIEILVANGADVNAKRDSGWTPLFDLVYQQPWKGVFRTKSRDVADALIAHGANVNARDKKGMTPLIWVAVRGNKDVAEWLLDHGANINAKDEDDWTALHVATNNDHPETVKLLLERGVDITLRNAEGLTALGLAVKRGRQQIIDIFNQHLEKKNHKEK